MRRIGMVGLVLLLGTSMAHGNAVERSVSDVAYIDNGEGESRVLFRWGDLSELGHIVIKGARLEIPITGSATERALELRFHNLTTEWNAGSVSWSNGWSRPGGDFDESVYSALSLDLGRGAHAATADVSQLLKEVYESGASSEGVLLTLHSDEAEREGIASGDLSRFSSLASATLHVDYVKVPRSPAVVR